MLTTPAGGSLSCNTQGKYMDEGKTGRGSGRKSGEHGTNIDVFALAREGTQVEGTLPIVRFSRVIEDLPEQAGDGGQAVSWSAKGSKDSAGQSLLTLHIQARPLLICQRCLMPFVYPVDTAVTVQLVQSANEVDAEDVGLGLQSDDEEELEAPEKIVGSHRFDVLALVEDELLLSIPFVPKHDECPDAPLVETDDEPEEAAPRKSPFAVLENLKQKL